ncbi:hypothetical protein EDD86DRAFT_243952 [Gorgonomyces haynaldii]|nr:hypothetical protein EDD86DRAFT_243952 [Gorgonomyces haynaldii]
MNIFEDLKKGKAGIWATYVALLSALLLFIFASTGIGSHALFFVFTIIGWAEGLLVLLIEFPFCAKIFRGTDRVLQVSGNKNFKAITYLVFSILIWLSLLLVSTIILLPAVTLLLAAAFSVYRNEGAEGNSSIQDGRAWAGAAATAAARV